MEGTGEWMNQLLLVAVAASRFGFAFIFVPIFAPDTIPAMVRNSIIITLGMVSYFMQPAFDPAQIGAFAWARLLLKEAAVGVTIGFLFGAVMWALEAAGEVIDAKVGATIGQVVEPLGGSMTSLHGALLGRLAQVIFASAGGILLLVGTVMESYVLWPMSADWPTLDASGLLVFETAFGQLMALVVLFAVPVLVLLYVIDAGLGLLNRFAQQLNVFAMSLSLKSWAATLMIMLLVPAFARAVIDDLAGRSDQVRSIVEALAQ